MEGKPYPIQRPGPSLPVPLFVTDLELLLQRNHKASIRPAAVAADRGGVLINDEVLYTELCDKLDIIRGLPDFELSARKKERLVKLRNQLAHANEFAASEESALRACETVRDALDSVSRSGGDESSASGVASRTTAS